MQQLNLRDVHQRIAEMARELHSQSGESGDVVLSRLADFAVSAIPGADYAGITATVDRKRIETLVATHSYPKLLDDIQKRYKEGPYLEAASGCAPVRVDDLAADTRWPAYGLEAVAQTPIRSVMAFKLFTAQEPMGALNVYAEQPHAFDSAAEEIGVVFATHAALAWDNLRRERQFRRALESRDAIGQAKGMIMERYRLDADAAFQLLTKMSQNSNTPVAVVARELIEIRQLPRV